MLCEPVVVDRAAVNKRLSRVNSYRSPPCCAWLQPGETRSGFRAATDVLRAPSFTRMSLVVLYMVGTSSLFLNSHFFFFFLPVSACSRVPIGDTFKGTYSRYASRGYSATNCIPVGLLIHRWTFFSKCQRQACSST